MIEYFREVDVKMKRGLTRTGAILTSIALAITFARGYERFQTLRAVDFDLKRELSGRFGALLYGNAFDFDACRIWFEKVAVNIGRLVKSEPELTIGCVDLNANGMSYYSRGDRYLSEYAGQYDVVDEYWREAVDQVKSAISVDYSVYPEYDRAQVSVSYGCARFIGVSQYLVFSFDRGFPEEFIYWLNESEYEEVKYVKPLGFGWYHIYFY